MHMVRDLWALLVVTAVVWLSASNAAAAEAVFSDRFDNLGNWTSVQGAEPKLGLLQAGEATTSPCMILANGVVRADLPRTLDSSFELSFRAINSDYSRTLWVGMFNEDGSKGYAALWSSATATSFQGEGAVTISRFDLGKEPSWTDKVGAELIPRISSGRKAVGVWPPVFVLTWDKASGLLTLKVDGIVKARVIDRTFGSFSKVYMRGNAASVIADVRICEKPGATARPSGAAAR